MQITNSNEQITDNFKMSEFYCKSKDAPISHELDYNLIKAAQYIREQTGIPVRITSSFRTVQGNKDAGSKLANSPHTIGIAIDLQAYSYLQKLQFMDIVTNWWLNKTIQYKTLRQLGISGYGIYDTFLHIDTRGNGNEYHKYTGSDTYGNYSYWNSSLKKKSNK
ncbi:MAG: hypothetical protein K9J13_13910 [Saprospiraceae bacterium]|nr:hypothetical protein [Saprospiraceae bacterium]